MYKERTYRKIMGKDLEHILLSEQESDIWIGLPKDSFDDDLIAELKHQLKIHRLLLKKYIEQHEVFQSTLKPYPPDEKAPVFIQEMIRASNQAGVGPMASVAGAFTKIIGDFMQSSNVESYIIENGGDLLIAGFLEITIAVHAGDSIFTDKIGIKINSNNKEYGICSSSGMFGHSFSFGVADLVTIISDDIYLADAFATAIANKVMTAEDIKELVEVAKHTKGISGALLIKEETLGAFGDFEIVEI